MRVPTGSTDRYLYFVAVDSTDLKTRETALGSFSAFYSLNGAAETQYTTPTVTEIDATNMPGVYALLLDEGNTISASHDEAEMCIHITQASMAPVTRTYELFRPKITEGQTVTAANGAADADIERLQGSVIATPTIAGVLEVDVTHWIGTAAATPTTAGVPEVDVTFWLGTAAQGASGRPQVDVELIEGGDATDALTAAVPSAAVIADAVWDEDATAHQTQGTFGQAIGDPVADTNTIYKAVVTDATGATVGVDVVAVKAETALIIADTDDIQTRLPAALVSGRMDSSVGAMAADVMTAAALAADAVAEIADAVWDELMSAHQTDDTFGAGFGLWPTGESIQDSVSSLPNVSNIVTGVWDEDATTHQIQGTFGQAIGDPAADTNTIYKAVVTDATGATVGVDVAALNNLSAAQVNAEVVDVLATDTYAEPGQNAPAATATLAAKINYLYKAWRNKKTQTSSTWSLFADDAATVDQKATVSDDATTATVGEIATGP